MSENHADDRGGRSSYSYPANRQQLDPNATHKYCYGPTHQEGWELLPIDEFGVNNRTTDGRGHRCRTCLGIERQSRKYKRSGQLEVRRVWEKRYYVKNRELFLEQQRQRNLRIKLEIIEAYGGSCSCCGEREVTFLTIDHMQGRAERHQKREQALSGVSLYRWLKRNGFPRDEFRLLCMNCNWGVRDSGVCPHQMEKGGTQN